MPNYQNAPTSIQKLLFSVQEVMAVTGYPRTKVNSLIASNALQSFRDGKRRMILATSVDDYIQRMLDAAR